MSEQGDLKPLFGEVDPKRYPFLILSFAGMMMLFHGSEAKNPFFFWLGIGIMVGTIILRRLLYRWLRHRMES
jgi:hypothetical protein